MMMYYLTDRFGCRKMIMLMISMPLDVLPPKSILNQEQQR